MWMAVTGEPSSSTDTGRQESPSSVDFQIRVVPKSSGRGVARSFPPSMAIMGSQTSVFSSPVRPGGEILLHPPAAVCR